MTDQDQGLDAAEECRRVLEAVSERADSVARRAPSKMQLGSLVTAAVILTGGGQYLTTKDVAATAKEYTDAAEERQAKDLEAAELRSHALVDAHAKQRFHAGAVSKDTFEEFRRTLETALENVATRADVRALETSTDLLRGQVRDLEQKVDKVNDG